MISVRRTIATITTIVSLLTPLKCTSPDGVTRDKLDPPKGKHLLHASITFSSSDKRAWLRYKIEGSHQEELEWGLYSLWMFGEIDIWYAKDEHMLIKAWAELDRGSTPNTGPNARWISCSIEVGGIVQPGASDSTRGVTALSQEIFCRART